RLRRRASWAPDRAHAPQRSRNHRRPTPFGQALTLVTGTLNNCMNVRSRVQHAARLLSGMDATSGPLPGPNCLTLKAFSAGAGDGTAWHFYWLLPCTEQTSHE